MSPLIIAPEQSECLLRVMEAAPQVHRRHQFFIWSQGDFQRWLPHKISICGAYVREQRDVVFDIFNSVPVPEEVLSQLKGLQSSFMVGVLNAWRRSRYQACRASLQSLDPQVAAQLDDLGYVDCVIHGTTRPGRPHEVESLFVFMQHGQTYDDSVLHAIEMLLPCVYMVYQRVWVMERQIVSGRTQPGVSSGMSQVMPITERELEILRWVRDGMSNQQISEKLGISALTVKNHVQKILRKLGAANRAQAVAKAMSMNALMQPFSNPNDVSQ